MGWLLGEVGTLCKDLFEETHGTVFTDIRRMRTILIKIETVLNNHPLMYVYDDDNVVSYQLTPSQLIYGRRLTTTADGKYIRIKV